jgi:hypothetical protein
VGPIARHGPKIVDGRSRQPSLRVADSFYHKVETGGRRPAPLHQPYGFDWVQRLRAWAPFFAKKVTRVRLGDILPSKNETRLAPIDFGAVNFTRVRRGIFFPSRKVTVVLRFAAMVAIRGP